MAGRLSRAAWVSLLAAAFLAATGTVAAAADLVLFFSRTCPYCKAWERQIGPRYDKAPQASLLKLRRVDLDKRGVDPGVQLTQPIEVTPTFVIAACGRELARIMGYADARIFWTMLDIEIERNRAALAQGC